MARVLLGRPPRYRPRDPSPLPKRGPIYNVPVEILLGIFQLVTPPRTREGLYELSELTHVCRFWRTALINQPRVWSTIFVTQKDHRSFVEVCLQRSHPASLDVTMDAADMAWTRPGCTCDKDDRGRLLPDERNPCEWHFQFESLAEPKHSNRIRTLDINFDGGWIPATEGARVALGSCRFFTLSFPRLATLRWENESTKYANHLFSTTPFPPTLRSLTYVGAWSSFIMPVNNLTSFIFESDCGLEGISVELVRLFVLNNRSLESLEFKFADFDGDSEGPPVHLLNLKSLSIGLAYRELSTIIRVPAFRRLSSLRISSLDSISYTLDATGDGIAFSAKCFASDFAGTWEDFTGYARPAIHHIRLDDGPVVDGDHDITFVSVLLDAHTLETGNTYFPFWYDGFFLDDLKKLGPQFKTIRFAVPEELEPFEESDEYEGCGGFFLDKIEELVKYRFEQGRPFSVVERMVVGGSERTNRQEDYVWRSFYGSRKLSRYVRPV